MLKSLVIYVLKLDLGVYSLVRMNLGLEENVVIVI